MPVEAKPFLKSTTLQFNAISLFVLAAGIVADMVGVFPGMAADQRTQIALIAGAVVAFGNGALRLFRTSQPLSIQGQVPSVRPPDPQPPTVA